MNILLIKLVAFLKRDFQIAASYQLNFILTSINSIFILFMFFYIDKLITPSQVGIAQYSENYFSFVLIGYGFFQYFQLLLNSFSNSIQNEQMTGCLEAMLNTQTSPYTSILLSSGYSILISLIQIFIIFLASTLFFDFSLLHLNIFSSLIIFILSVLIFISFGILSAAFIIVLKKGDPISWIFTSTNFVLGGAFFPVSIMPEWLQNVSKFMPVTYMLDALRLSFLKGYSISMLSNQFFVLLIMNVFLLPLSLKTLSIAIKKAKKDGTLVHF